MTQVNRLKVPRYTPPITGPSPTCQWIMQEGERPRDAVMCGKPSVPGLSWCGEHSRRVASGFHYAKITEPVTDSNSQEDQEE